MNEKERIDVEMVRRGLASSRNRAAELIRNGSVLVGGSQVKKPSATVAPTDSIEVVEDLPYVGRGGMKLAHALSVFNVNVLGKTALDVGASTGGFTDCLLANGASKVYAVDVGHGQLAEKLHQDPRVVSCEGTDIRTFSPGIFFDLAVIDVSFIPATYVLFAVKNLVCTGGQIILLVKPQFEVGKAELGKNGIVKDEAARLAAVERVVHAGEELGLVCKAKTTSPIKGGSGNEEYLVLFETVA